VQEDLINLKDWKSRVAYVLHKIKNLSPKRKRYLESGLESSYIRINKLLNYKPTEKLLSGDVHLIRPEGALQEDHCDLHKYFQGTVNIHLVDGDHRTLLSNRATADIINNEALANICMNIKENPVLCEKLHILACPFVTRNDHSTVVVHWGTMSEMAAVCKLSSMTSQILERTSQNRSYMGQNRPDLGENKPELVISGSEPARSS
ncbi:unnamed protein product, partial [Timema podura]|nr:unnamed protein product [Timema podura]